MKRNNCAGIIKAEGADAVKILYARKKRGFALFSLLKD
jgi:hypothetical protein